MAGRTTLPLMLWLGMVLLAAALAGVCAAPFSATDSFTPPCALLADQNTAQVPDGTVFRRWSDPSAWPGGVVPGINGARGANATVSCGVAIELDIAELELGLLTIQGLLRFKDSSALPEIYLKAAFILVQGQLVIGTPTQHYSGKATIELTPNNANGRSSLYFTSRAPADAANPRSLGHKSFAVVGGQVHLHGMPGGSTTPSWCRLVRTANAGDSSIAVDAAGAASWPVGGQIVVASTDYSKDQAETFNIVAVTRTASGAIIALSGSFKYMHYGNPRGLLDGFGGYLEQRAEVALLTRNIMVTGTDEPAPYQYEGGHFIVFMTQRPFQFIEGVEFYKLGQQGNLGRYPIHFHLVGSNPGTVCRKNSIHHSKQRCLVVHASFDMTIDSNVAYNIPGHCFILEEGGEVGNTFVNNLGMVIQPVDKKILLPGSTISDETDDKPAVFWISNVRNNFLNNVAAGSYDSGFWIELRYKVRGLSARFAAVNRTSPIMQSVQRFENNVAHSNRIAGVRTYPNGILPHLAWRVPGPTNGTMNGLNIYKNPWMGMFAHNTEHLTISNATFADNNWGLYMHQDFGVKLVNSRMVGLSENYGSPDSCQSGSRWANCRPVSTCTTPLPLGAQGRSAGGSIRTSPIYGVLLDPYFLESFDSLNVPNQIISTTFHSFNSTCWNAAAITTFNEGDEWMASHRVRALTFSRSTNPVWVAPKISSPYPWDQTEDGGEQAQFHSFQDLDGSVIGAPGYVVADNVKILPPSKRNCTYFPKWNAYGCKGACYRTVRISYVEPGFASGSRTNPNAPGSFSSLQVTRVSDGQTMLLNGNLNVLEGATRGNIRFFFMSLLAGMTYRITPIPSSKAPAFFPGNISLSLIDYEGCGQALTLQIKPQGGKAWKAAANTDTVFFKPCPGASPPPAALSQAVYSYACISSQAWMEVVLGPVFYETVNIVQVADSIACSSTSECGALWSGSAGWRYTATWQAYFYGPQAPTGGWLTGAAPLGCRPSVDPFIKTYLPTPSAQHITNYFRKSFSLVNTACYTSLQVDLLVKDGVVLYLNNKELMRTNMPAGPITNGTLASSKTVFGAWSTFVLPLPGLGGAYSLVEGANYLAAEQHVFAQWAWETAFDLRISLTRKSSCQGARISPEVCDGLDNDNNGKIDEAANGQPLTQTCQSSCGTGIQTCTNGVFAKCTAPPISKEVCNAIDDDCDGLVDNGAASLDCPAGRVCFRGECLPAGSPARPLQVWPKNATGWAYYDKGGNLDAVNPSWRSGANINSWETGAGPLGFNDDNPSWDRYGTVIEHFGNDGVSLTAYFAKSFTLEQSEVAQIYSLDFNLRRVDGAVVYLNGVEVWRSAMPWGPITWTTKAAASAGTLQGAYHSCDACFHNTTRALQAGTNWITAELHMAWRYENHAAFDMDLWKNVVVPCTSLPGNPSECVRQVEQQPIPATSNWIYSDASLPFPPANWMLQAYTAPQWKSGQGPLGFGPNLDWLLNTNISPGSTADPRRTFYFRKIIQVPDGSCYFQLNCTMLSNDGAVVYINGVEAIRYNIPAGPVDASTYAVSGSDWKYHSYLLSGGWLRQGANVVAAELHRSAGRTANIFFDLQVEGAREAVTCSPAPL